MPVVDGGRRPEPRAGAFVLAQWWFFDIRGLFGPHFQNETATFPRAANILNTSSKFTRAARATIEKPAYVKKEYTRIWLLLWPCGYIQGDLHRPYVQKCIYKAGNLGTVCFQSSAALQEYGVCVVHL
jgi:hypothetical protein